MTDPVPAVFRDLLFGAPPEVSDKPAIEAWLLGHGMSVTDTEALLESDLGGLFVYRRLVRQTLLEALQGVLPKTLARLGGLFDEYFERFLIERGTRTHFLRDVTRELLDWAEPLFARDERIPRYILDLARHEALHIEVANLDAANDEPCVPELRVDREVRFTGACRVVHYAFAVHRLPEASTDRTIPEPIPTNLLVYRNQAHEVRYLELSPLASLIIEQLTSGASLGHAIEGACQELGIPVDDAVLDGAAELLGDLAERGALLGSKVRA